MSKRILVSDRRDGDLVLRLLGQLAQLVDRLARDDDARHAGGAVRQRLLDAGEAVAVRRHGAQHLGAVAVGGVQVDAVEVVARLLRADGEARAVHQLAQLAGRQGEAVRQLALGHGREILHRQDGEIGVEAAGAQLQGGIAAGVVQLDLGALGQLADDLIEGRGRGGGAAGAADLDPRHVLDHRDLHVGRGQLQAVVLHRDEDVGEDGDGVAALHHALDMRQRLEQDRPFHRELHATQAPPTIRPALPFPTP